MNAVTLSYKRVGVISFVKVGRLTLSFCIKRKEGQRRPLHIPFAERVCLLHEHFMFWYAGGYLG